MRKARIVVVALAVLVLLATVSCKDVECTWDNGIVQNAPTCTEKGSMLYTCVSCGATKVEDVPALGHSYSVETGDRKAATCTEDGYVVMKCERCDATAQKTTEGKRGHSYVKRIVKNATCDETGLEETICATCGNKDQNVPDATIPVLGHDFSIKDHAVEPTCLDDGYTVYKCSRCDKTEDRKDAQALGHSYTVETSDRQESTCDAEGYVVMKCERCDSTWSKPIAKLDHDWQKTSYVVDPTCTEEGYTAYQCSKCLKKENLDIQRALGHSYTDHVEKEATCTEDGLKIRWCVRCNEKDPDSTDVVLPKLGHNYQYREFPPTCTVKGYMKSMCTRCDAKGPDPDKEIAALGHDYVNDGDTKVKCSREGCELSYDNAQIAANEADLAGLVESARVMDVYLTADISTDSGFSLTTASSSEVATVYIHLNNHKIQGTSTTSPLFKVKGENARLYVMGPGEVSNDYTVFDIASGVLKVQNGVVCTSTAGSAVAIGTEDDSKGKCQNVELTGSTFTTQAPRAYAVHVNAPNANVYCKDATFVGKKIAFCIDVDEHSDNSNLRVSFNGSTEFACRYGLSIEAPTDLIACGVYIRNGSSAENCNVEFLDKCTFDICRGVGVLILSGGVSFENCTTPEFKYEKTTGTNVGFGYTNVGSVSVKIDLIYFSVKDFIVVDGTKVDLTLNQSALDISKPRLKEGDDYNNFHLK